MNFRELLQRTLHVGSIYGLNQIINTPTRVTNRSASLIDVVYTTHAESVIEHGCVHTSISDHFLVYTIRKVHSKKEKHSSTTVSFRSFKNFDKKDFQEMLNTASWPDFDDITDINELWNKWKLIFSDMANKAAPQKNVRLRNVSHVWLSKDIKNLMIKRDYVHNKFLNLKKKLTYDNIEQETLCNELWNEYKMLRNKVNISMKDCKATYYKTAIEKYSGNAGKMWKCLSSLLPSKKKSLPYHFSIDNQLCSDNFTIANSFNTYFINSIMSLSNNDRQSIIDNVQSTACPHSFDFTPVNEDYVEKII